MQNKFSQTYQLFGNSFLGSVKLFSSLLNSTSLCFLFLYEDSLISLKIHWTHGLYGSMLFNFLIFRIFSLILLWSEKMMCMIASLLSFGGCVLWSM